MSQLLNAVVKTALSLLTIFITSFHRLECPKLLYALALIIKAGLEIATDMAINATKTSLGDRIFWFRDYVLLLEPGD